MTTSVVPQEEIFRRYTAEEGKFYAAQRLAYPPVLYNLVFDHHAKTGGAFNLLLDVGCGPGNSTRDLATRFENALAVDASPGMIESARQLGGNAKSGASIRFETSPAEAYSQVEGLEPESVDLLTVATAAHWFDMSKFWGEAAKVLKPGGTVAIWTRTQSTCHPDTPNAAVLKDILDKFQNKTLEAFEQPGSKLNRGLYEDLIKPWEGGHPVASFPESLYVRHVFDKDGIPSEGDDYFGGSQYVTLEDAKKGLTTASSVKKWRDAHPELVGTEKDLVEVLMAKLQAAMGGQTSVRVGAATTILLFKKPAEAA